MEQFLQQLLDRASKNGQSSDTPPVSFIEIIDAFRQFVEELPVMVYAVEARPPYSPIYVSPAFKLLGYPLDEWTTNPEMWKRVLHPEDQARIFSVTDSSNETGEDVDYEYRIIAANGRVHWFHDRGCLIRDVNGNVTHRQGVIFDITEQKRADKERRKVEADLGESETRYRALFENANDIIYV